MQSGGSSSPCESGAVTDSEVSPQRPSRSSCACCAADRPLHENLFGELVCDLHEATTFFGLLDVVTDDADGTDDESNGGNGGGNGGVGGGGDRSCAYCTTDHYSSSSLSENLFGETVCGLHHEAATPTLFGMFVDDGLGGAEGGANSGAKNRADNGAGDEEIAKKPAAHHQVAVEEAANKGPALFRAVNTIQKVWREPKVRARCNRAYALRLGQPKWRLWAVRKILAAWRRHEGRVAEAAVAEAEETEAAVAMVAAVEAAEAAEAVGGAAAAVVVGGGSPADDGELVCAYCADRPLYENLLGELVCRLHEEVTFIALHPSADDGANNRAAPITDEAEGEERGAAAPDDDSQCPVCDVEMADFGSGRDRKGGRCAFGHALCAACTTRYVKETLLPQGTVFWDRIRCVNRTCTSYMRGMSVRRSIIIIDDEDEELVKRVEAGQLDAAHLVCGERDPSSQEVVAEFTRPCPNCDAPTEKNGGCDHMTCTVCKHQYWYSCSCVHPNHTRQCDARR